MSLHELLVDELKDLYSAESQLVKALPKMAKASVSAELKQAFSAHLEETKGHVERLKKAFEAINEKPKAVLCKGMQGLLEEGQERIDEDGGDVFGDLALIGAAERVEHYEVAAYTTSIALAKSLGYTEASSLLNETLQEESKTAKLLFALSKPMIKEAKDTKEEEEE
jgi:ferritin-like metal-binding protein YciE